MKKLIAILLAMILVITCCACASQNTETEDQSNQEQTSTTETTQETEETETSEGEDTSDTEAAAYGQIENLVPTTVVKVPESLRVAVVMGNASMSGGSVPCAAIEKICADYGWEIQTWDGEGDPSKENDAIISALSWGADCIITACIQANNVQSSLQAASEAGIPVGSLSCGNDSPNPVLPVGGFNFAYDVGPDYDGLGYAFGDWIQAHTEGSGKIACWDFAGEYSIDYLREGLYRSMSDKGIAYDERGCFTFDQLGDVLNRQVASYLTNNPDTEFLFFPFDPAAQPVSEFLDLNGYTDVKVLGVLGNAEMVALINQGSVATATAAYDNTYMGYAAMDQMLRVLAGQDLIEPHGENVPYLILDETNAVESDVGWTAPFDYAASYYAIWQK